MSENELKNTMADKDRDSKGKFLSSKAIKVDTLDGFLQLMQQEIQERRKKEEEAEHRFEALRKENEVKTQALFAKIEKFTRVVRSSVAQAEDETKKSEDGKAETSIAPQKEEVAAGNGQADLVKDDFGLLYQAEGKIQVMEENLAAKTDESSIFWQDIEKDELVEKEATRKAEEARAALEGRIRMVVEHADRLVNKRGDKDLYGMIGKENPLAIKLKDVEQEKENLRNDLDSKEARIDELKEKENSDRATIYALQLELEDVKEAKKKLENEKAALEEAEEEGNDKLDKEIAELQKQLVEKEKEIAEFQRQLVEKNKDLELAEASLDMTKAEFAKVKNAGDQNWEIQKKYLDAQIDNLGTENQRLKGIASEAETHKEQIEELKKQMEAKDSEFKQMADEFAKASQRQQALPEAELMEDGEEEEKKGITLNLNLSKKIGLFTLLIILIMFGVLWVFSLGPFNVSSLPDRIYERLSVHISLAEMSKRVSEAFGSKFGYASQPPALEGQVKGTLQPPTVLMEKSGTPKQTETGKPATYTEAARAAETSEPAPVVPATVSTDNSTVPAAPIAIAPAHNANSSAYLRSSVSSLEDLTRLRAMHEELTIRVQIAEQEAKLAKLREESAAKGPVKAVTLPALPTVVSATPKFRVVSVQGIDGKLVALTQTNDGPKTVRVGDTVPGFGKVARITSQGVRIQMNEKSTKTTLFAIEE